MLRRGQDVTSILLSSSMQEEADTGYPLRASSPMATADHEERKASSCGLSALYNGLFRRRGESTPRRFSNTPVNSGTAATKQRSPGEIAALVVATLPSKQMLASVTNVKDQAQRGGGVNCKTRPVAEQPVRTLSITKELDSMIYDHQQTKGGSTLVRASSSNVMLVGDLGNLRTATNSINTGSACSTTSTRQTEEQTPAPADAPSLCRAISRRLDPDELKEMGNEEYKKGRFAEAVALYDRAIALDPRRATYRSNRAAALTGLGRFLEAVGDCREAVRMDPSYKRAHHRLATLYLRLGEADKALHHYKLSGNEVNPGDVLKAKTLQAHINKCNEARMQKDWQTVLQEAQSANASGADSAPQVFAAQVDALLKLRRHDEAYSISIDAPIFDIDESTKFFGTYCSAYILTTCAQISMAAGRFDEAVSMAYKASQIDPSNKDIAATSRRARAMAMARTKGNDLFKAGRFAEACIAYGEGLDQDSYNSILLCNRATCRAKLAQYDKAVEDCNLALVLRPSYSKARLRRAECNQQLEKWEDAIKDYELLLDEMPNDQELQKALSEAQARLRRQMSSSDVMGPMKTKGGVAVVTSSGDLSDIIMLKGASVILFCDETCETKEMIPFMGQLSRKYPSINFFKVEKEDLTRSSGVNTLPAFRIYENGSLMKDMNGCDWDLLEKSIMELIN